jgi:hypothetical protein
LFSEKQQGELKAFFKSPFSPKAEIIEIPNEIKTMNIVTYVETLDTVIKQLNSSTKYQPVVPICEKIVNEINLLKGNGKLTETVSNYVISRIQTFIKKLKGFRMYTKDRDELINFLNTNIIGLITNHRILYNPTTNLDKLGNLYAKRAIEANRAYNRNITSQT